MHRHGSQFLTTADLQRQGLSLNDIRARLKTGQLRRVRRGVYALDDVEDPELRHKRLIEAALLAVDPTSVVSHISAGVLHGLPVPRSQLEKAYFTRRSPGHGNHGDHLVVRRTRIGDDEVTTLNGIPVTNLARTVADLSRTSPFEWGVMAADAALHSGEVSPAMLREALERHPRLGGKSRASSAIDFADGRSESPAESLSRVSMARAGIPMPQLQVPLYNEAGEFVARPDYLWEEYRLVGEVDGMSKYTTLLRDGETAKDAIRFRERRDEGIRQVGYWVVHWDYQIAGDHAALGKLIRGGMSHQLRRLES